MRNVTVRLGLLKKYNRCIYLSYICSISILYIISYIHIQCTHRDAINGLENMETWPSWLVDPYMFQSLFKVQSRCIAQVKYHVYIYIFMDHIHLYEYRYHICIYASYRICGTIYLSIYLCIYIYSGPGQHRTHWHQSLCAQPLFLEENPPQTKQTWNHRNDLPNIMLSLPCILCIPSGYD
jgi:hypothetical protein